MPTLISALLLAALTLGNPVYKRQFFGPTTCFPGVYMIVPPSHDSSNVGFMSTLVNNVSALIPQSTYAVIEYDSYSQDYGTALPAAQAAVVNEIERYVAMCPSNTVAVIGLSEGGIVAMNVVCGNRDGTNQLSQTYVPNLVGAIGYGEEFFVPNTYYDYGTCTGQGPSTAPRPYPDVCNVFEFVTRSYCDVGDPRCCSGSDPAAHTAYPNIYDEQVAHFILYRYNLATGAYGDVTKV